MTQIAKIVVVLTAIVLTTGHVNNMGQNTGTRWTGQAQNGVSRTLQVQSQPMNGFNGNAVNTI